ncbi:MAG TPA: gamma-glutamyl-gamma-aminobutyrate hydrolase family protein [Planctomycetota bacterium]|nr:gamma-glutamyl-gamma-aminobutyrate hydrolase family protein [Planctomycetota bacterium]
MAHGLSPREETGERHRHRFEVNNRYISALIQAGLVVSGRNTELDLVEIIELPNHDFYIAVQFHPEFKSKPLQPHPIFRGFVRAAVQHQARKKSPEPR